MRLKCMTRDHPRGYDPIVDTSGIYAEFTGVEIAWDKRSLQAFADEPNLGLAKRFDFIVLDHPHVGQIADSGALLPLAPAGRPRRFAGRVCRELSVERHTLRQCDRRRLPVGRVPARPAGPTAEALGGVPRPRRIPLPPGHAAPAGRRLRHVHEPRCRAGGETMPDFFREAIPAEDFLARIDALYRHHLERS